MQAAELALRNPNQPFLFVIDEINRADLSKILGEAIYLFESNPLTERVLQLSYNFGGRFGNQF